MKLVMKVPNGFGKIVNGEPIILCFGSHIYKTHSYAMFGDKAEVLLSDIDWLQPGSTEQKPEPYEKDPYAQLIREGAPLQNDEKIEHIGKFIVDKGGIPNETISESET